MINASGIDRFEAGGAAAGFSRGGAGFGGGGVTCCIIRVYSLGPDCDECALGAPPDIP
jgi:hypothetical protein